MSKSNNIISTQSSACYKKSNVLINKLDIKNSDELETIEKKLSVLKISYMHIKGIPNVPFSLTVDYLFEIHRYIFGDLYDFAGKIRTENIIKDDTLFCCVEYISINLYRLFKEMNLKIKKIKTRDDLVLFLAYYYGELNIIHPFREGNGRTIREFLYQLVENYNKINNTNYILDYKIVDEKLKEILILGSVENAKSAEDRLLIKFFDCILKEKEKIKEVIK